jgi:3-keto-disaccharide hydrolase
MRWHRGARLFTWFRPSVGKSADAARKSACATSDIALRALLVAYLISAPAWAQAQAGSGEWKPIFDGSSLQGWRETPFSGRGKVQVEDGSIVLEKGILTGVTWTGEFPKFNYELRLEAMRVSGYDFFAGITFPVHDSFCSWINGGWGGMVVGLSSLDDMDASENDTSLRRNFESGRWYALRLRVTEDRIQAWIDGERVIDAYIATRLVGLRPGEIDRSTPFGIASYSTVARLRKIEYRLLP